MKVDGWLELFMEFGVRNVIKHDIRKMLRLEPPGPRTKVFDKLTGRLTT